MSRITNIQGSILALFSRVCGVEGRLSTMEHRVTGMAVQIVGLEHVHAFNGRTDAEKLKDVLLKVREIEDMVDDYIEQYSAKDVGLRRACMMLRSIMASNRQEERT